MGRHSKYLRNIQLKILVTHAEHTKIKEAAARYGVSIADLVRLRALHAIGLPVDDRAREDDA